MTEVAVEQFTDQSFFAEPSIDMALSQRIAKLLAEGNEDVYRIVIEPIEREVVRNVVAHCQGNYLRASRILGISRMTLRKKIGVKRKTASTASVEDHAADSLVSAPVH